MATQKRPVGRPKRQLDERQITDMASIGLTVKEIAGVLRRSYVTIHNDYPDSVDLGRARMRASLRRKQYETAMSGNATMLIWLGKQYLGQSAKRQVETSRSELGDAIRQARDGSVGPQGAVAA
jgi:hypothetical protein